MYILCIDCHILKAKQKTNPQKAHLMPYTCSSLERIVTNSFQICPISPTYEDRLLKNETYSYQKEPRDYVIRVLQWVKSTWNNLTLRAMFTEQQSVWHDKDYIYLSGFRRDHAPYHLIRRGVFDDTTYTSQLITKLAD